MSVRDIIKISIRQHHVSTATTCYQHHTLLRHRRTATQQQRGTDTADMVKERPAMKTASSDVLPRDRGGHRTVSMEQKKTRQNKRIS